jgi:hypothetical protein
MEGVAVGSEEGKALGSGLRHAQRLYCVFNRNSDINVERAACEECNITSSLSTNSAFALGQKKTTGNVDRFGRPQDLSDAN